MKVTSNRLVILKSLAAGPQQWSVLRAAFYVVPERIASNASTSFQNQLMKMSKGGLIQKVNDLWEITELGRMLLGQIDPAKVESAKTVAARLAEINKELGS